MYNYVDSRNWLLYRVPAAILGREDQPGGDSATRLPLRAGDHRASYPQERDHPIPRRVRCARATRVHLQRGRLRVHRGSVQHV